MNYSQLTQGASSEGYGHTVLFVPDSSHAHYSLSPVMRTQELLWGLTILSSFDRRRLASSTDHIRCCDLGSPRGCLTLLPYGRWNPHRGQSGVTTGLLPVSSKVNPVVQDRGFKDWEGRNSSPRFRREASCDRSDKLKL